VLQESSYVGKAGNSSDLCWQEVHSAIRDLKNDILKLLERTAVSRLRGVDEAKEQHGRARRALFDAAASVASLASELLADDRKFLEDVRITDIGLKEVWSRQS
jgi:hypothetical protein